MSATLPGSTLAQSHNPASRWQRFLDDSAMLRHYLWKYRSLVAVGLGALLLVDLIEIIPPLILRKVVDEAVVHESERKLLVLAAAYFGISLVQGVGRYGWRMYLIRSSLLAGRDIRDQYVAKLLSLSAHFYDKRRIGELMSLASSDVEAVRMALGVGFLVLGDAIFYFISVPVAMCWLSPKLTLIAILPVIVVPWYVARNEREIHRRFEKLQESFSQLSAMIQENLNGMRVIKAFAREDRQVARLEQAGNHHIELSLSLARVSTTFGPMLDYILSLGLVILLYFGGRWSVAGALSIGTFVAFQRYMQRMVWPMTAFAMAVNHYQRAVTSSSRLEGILNEQSNVPEPLHPQLPKGADSLGAWKTPGRLQLKNLRFRYPGATQDVLRGISLTIEPGERIALIGSIGSGKSALLTLIPRLYPVDRGMLLIDGVDVCDWPLQELRSQIGYVSQDVFLFSETVVENLALDERAQLDTSLIERSAIMASVHDDVLLLEEGYQTQLGERGVNLSGGQKQRLTIARALAKQPSILVLDDALSSVDVQTEEKILQGLRRRPGRNTEIIAAHRISTIKDADRIVYLENGQILQVGTHRQLVAANQNGYRLFFEQQRLKEDLDRYVEHLT